MTTYELMLILSPHAMAEEAETTKKEIEALFKKAKVTVLATDDWGEKTLSHRIAKHDRGYYVVYQIEMEPKNMDALQQGMKLSKPILRSLLTLAPKINTSTD